MSDLQCSATEVVVSQQPTAVMSSINHPRLLKVDARLIRTFLRLYDEHGTTVLQRAQHLLSSMVSFETIRPFNIKFCVDPELFKSLIDLDLIEGVDSVSALTEDRLRTYLRAQALPSKNTTNHSSLGKIVSYELYMRMTDNDVK